MYKYRDKKPIFFILLFAGFVLLIFLLMQPVQVWHGGAVSLLAPKGSIALKQRNLLLIIQALMLLVVIPVYVLTFVFSWKYQAYNTKAKYDPDLRESKLAEYIWWGLPFILIIIIGTLMWIRTYQLDPFRPIVGEKPPLKIQVVALQWKWLFIYPEEKIAVVNFLPFPVDTPLHFEITADAPMNSFWIPQLGGQIYAMPKMTTRLHLIADTVGEFHGSSANLSGEGFAGMHFVAKSSSEEDYKKWIEEARSAPKELTLEAYHELARPSQNDPVKVYQLKEENLFQEILMKYMHPHEPISVGS